MGKKDRKPDEKRGKLSWQREEQLKSMKKLGSGIALFVVGLAVLAKLIVDPAKVQTLRVTDTDSLTNILFGGEPWLIQCVNDTVSQTAVAEEAAKAFKLKSTGIRVGAVDCDAKLPQSGQSIYKRFFKKKRPTYFTSANGNSLAVVPAIQATSATTLVKHVTDATKPRFMRITGQRDLRTKCLKRSSRPCLLLLTSTTQLEQKYNGIDKFIMSRRSTPVAWMNTSKYDLALPGLEDFKADSESVVVLMKSKQSKSKSLYSARAVHLEENAPLSYDSFGKLLDDAAAGHLPMTALSKDPSVRSHRIKKREAKIPKAKPQEEAKRTMTDAERKTAFERKEEEDQLIWSGEEEEGDYDEGEEEEEDEDELVIL
ncbi:hypothetical protein CYMTET_14807 [Cymbomonas tetramitiformis]|uniref:Uncharacterized protein n=1 Tax=Cymbomonas tetramitiformis TaxID=36881 RepID=A0AAE0GGT4_9CHLO|nr:hypothetical protein CYMTET_14807 [Cymbomonas tetramitiformis]